MEDTPHSGWTWYRFKKCWNFPGYSMLPLQGTPVQFLVGELKSCMLQGAAEKQDVSNKSPMKPIDTPSIPSSQSQSPRSRSRRGQGAPHITSQSLVRTYHLGQLGPNTSLRKNLAM